MLSLHCHIIIHYYYYMRSYYDLKCTVYLCSARVGSSWWNLWKKDIPIWVFDCWNAIWVLQWDKCQTEVSKCYDLDQHSYWVLFFIFRSFTAIIVPNFGFAKTHGKWLVLVHLRAQLEMLNLIVLSNWLRLNTVDHLNSVFKFRFEYFNDKIYFLSTHWKSSY